MTSVGLGSGESKLETAISYLLIIGVIISLLLEIIGIVIFYNSYGHLDITEEEGMFIRGHNFFTFLYDQFQGKSGESALLFMGLGIAVLMLTPYLRVIASVLYFAREKNMKYVLITLFVLIVLTISLFLH